jgi:hypothetical protein
MSRTGYPYRPYGYSSGKSPKLRPFHPSHKVKRIRVTPVPELKNKLAHVSAWSDLGWDFVYTDSGNNITKGSVNKDRSLTFSSANTFSGTTNPYWQDQIRSGINATTPANGVKYELEQAWLSAEITAFQVVGKTLRNVNYYGHVPLIAPTQTAPSASQVTFASNRAIMKFLDKLDSATSSIEAGQDFGEWRETVNGVTNPLHSLRNLTLGYFDKLLKLKRSFKQPSVSFAKAVADTYLEWTFGWKPLTLDIANGIVGLRERAKHYDYQPIKAGFKLDYLGSDSLAYHSRPDSAAILSLSTSTKTLCSYIESYQGAVRTGFGGTPIPRAEVLQLDLPHFIPTIWDLIPYSFVVDYFVNVGDVIRAYSLNTSKLAWCKKTIVTVQRIDQRDWIDVIASPSAYEVRAFKPDSGNSYIERKTFSRGSVSPGSLRPVLAFHLPISDKPWENIAALLTSRISSIVPLRFR